MTLAKDHPLPMDSSTAWGFHNSCPNWNDKGITTAGSKWADRQTDRREEEERECVCVRQEQIKKTFPRTLSSLALSLSHSCSCCSEVPGPSLKRLVFITPVIGIQCSLSLIAFHGQNKTFKIWHVIRTLQSIIKAHRVQNHPVSHTYIQQRPLILKSMLIPAALQIRILITTHGNSRTSRSQQEVNYASNLICVPEMLSGHSVLGVDGDEGGERGWGGAKETKPGARVLPGTTCKPWGPPWRSARETQRKPWLL